MAGLVIRFVARSSGASRPVVVLEGWQSRTSRGYIRLYQRIFVLVCVFSAYMGFEVIKPRPPFPRGAIARFRTCGTNIANLVSDSGRCPMHRLAMPLEVILGCEALCSGTAGFATSKRL
jgi:hypothetical protein